MTQQQISTPSVLDIDDSKILSSAAYTSIGVSVRDPWDEVLLALEARALTPNTVVAGMDNAASPSAANPFITRSYLDLKLTNRGIILIGHPGSYADFEGTTDDIFNTAIASLPPYGGVIGVLAGSYTFNFTVSLPESVTVIGVHPQSVMIQGTGDFPTFNLGDYSRLEFLTIENPAALSSPVVTVTGQDATLFGCHVYNYPLLGVGMTGTKSCVTRCRIESSGGAGIRLQGLYQTVEYCSFSDSLSGGVLHFDGSRCSALSNSIHSSALGASYTIPSVSCVNNKIVANHLGSSVSVTTSLDNGTGTIRYANTPDTAKTNENNFLIALQSYTGQPLLDSTEMVLTNHFAHDTAVDKNATSILSSLDLFTQRIYEERYWLLTSDDPIFDSVGVPTSGVCSWNGSLLVYPNFKIQTMVPAQSFDITGNSLTVSAGDAVVVDIDRNLLTASVSIKAISLLLENPSDSQQFVLAYSPAANVLVWTKGHRILTALTSFDIDGIPLPINRFIGISTDGRNTPEVPVSFAQGNDLTEKIGSQSSLLRSLYERSNLSEISSSQIEMTNIVGDWVDLTSNAPEPNPPTHLVQIQGTTYGLFPSYGVYRWYRETAGENPGAWGLVPSCPAGPFASMSYVGSGLALLTASGVIHIYSPELASWSSPVTPTTSLTLPLPTVRSGQARGQSDYAVQTPYYSLFSLLDGRSAVYFQKTGTLHGTHRVFTETPRCQTFLGASLKDSGLNVARDGWLDTVSNGAGSTLQGLPQFNQTSGGFEIPPYVYAPSLSGVKWDQLSHESFSYDPNSNGYLLVAFNGNTYYVLGGGLGISKLLSVITIGTTLPFTDFTPHGWLTNVGGQEIVCFGATVSNSEFTVIHGKINYNAQVGVDNCLWTKTVLGAANSSKGGVGVIDQIAGNIHILASDLSRASRPTWWKYSRATQAWTSETLADVGGSVTLAQAAAGSFTYDYSVDRMAAFGASSHNSVHFLVRDMARGGRPTLFSYNGSSYSGVRLSESPLVAPADVAVVGANTTCVSQFYGGCYQRSWDAFIWAAREGTNGQIRLLMYFYSTNTWSPVMSIGLTGSHLTGLDVGSPSFFKRTASLISISTPTDYIDTVTSRDVYIWSSLGGLLKGTLTGYLTGVTGALWSQHDKRKPTPLPMFPSSVNTTYSPVLGGSRCDISLQIGSFAEKTLPIFGVGLSETSGGLFWFEPGTKVKQITSTIWAGLNRNGYLWIGNPAFSNFPQELTPNPNTVRGDFTVTNLGNTDDFDWAFNGTQTQIAFVYKDLANGSKLAFLLYNIAANAVIHERGASSGSSVLNSTPQISHNPFNDSWSIVAQDTAVPASNAKMFLFRRLVATGTWLPDEQVLASGSGRKPAKPIHHTDGSIVVVTEMGAANDALVSMRSHTSGWLPPIYQTTGGGFSSPKFIKTLDNSKFWIFGGSGGRIAWASDMTSGPSWSIWPGSLTNIGYSRNTVAVPLAQTSSVIVATSCGVDGSTPANREMMFWRFNNDGSSQCLGGFTAKGRLQSASYSGEEEDGITDLSWTPDQKLLYGALRPIRSTLHWSLRGSTSNWSLPMGDSLLGSGRYLTIGEKHYREQWSSASGEQLIIEYPSCLRWSSLPLAQRESDTDLLSLKWPYLTSSGRLFTKGDRLTLTDDTSLPSGTLITSSSRDWPIVLGNTRIGGLYQTGAAVLSQGAMLGLFAPLTSTTLAYFGIASLGSNNLFKINALTGITFKGTRVWRDNVSRIYTLVGPVTFQIDQSLAALGSHLVLEFNTASSLTLDATESPLSYWTDQNQSNTNYAVVIGEVGEQEIYLYPSRHERRSPVALTYSNFEPIELLAVRDSWRYATPHTLDLSPIFEIYETGSLSVSFKMVGSLKGYQPILFTPSVQKQIALRRLLPMGGWFLFQSSQVRATSQTITALTSITDSTVILDKLSGDITL